MLRLRPQTAKFFSNSCVRYASTKVIGIDLGTTNSAVAYIRDSNDKKSASIIENDEGQRTTPSVVAFDKNGKVLVGAAAKRQSLINSENTFFATKRLIGRSFQDSETQKDLDVLPYKIVENKSNGQAYLQTSDGSQKSPSEIGSFVLKYLKGVAEKYLEETVNKAVITVPAYFNDSQRQATKDAGTMAGLKVMRVVNEPTAAALSFGLDSKNDGIIAVYDLGGGTFDISILDIEDGVFEVRATNGDTHLGGEDFDNVVVNYVIDKFVEQNPSLKREDIVANRELMQRIKDASETAKIRLSHIKETNIEIPFAYENKHINVPLKEVELDNITMHLIAKTVPPVKKALKDADIDAEDIDDVILVGGMTRMPKIRTIVAGLFGQKPNVSVNPDETVALGAAIQGGVLSGEIKNVLLLDVTPLTIGIETYGGVFSPLIPRNSTVPIKKTEMFSTGVDGQTGVDIRVYQGERGLVRDNKLIGDLKLAGIPPMPKGVPQIQVTFDIDADGIINVSAAETSSGKEEKITVIANSGLTEEEINSIVEEANANRERDNLIRQRVELITKADIMISDTENAFERFHDVIVNSPSYEDTLNAVKAVRAKIDHFKQNDSDLSLDVNVIKKETDSVQNQCLKLFQEASKQKQSSKNE
ncbi:Ssq1 [Kluyveromyces lactis]|nr:Ssq1 [Kluyveromyces lactis]